MHDIKSQIAENVHGIVQETLQRHKQRRTKQSWMKETPIHPSQLQTMVHASKYMDKSIMQLAQKQLVRLIRWNIPLIGFIAHDINMNVRLLIPADMPKYEIEFIGVMIDICLNIVLSLGDAERLQRHIGSRDMSITILMTDAKKQLCTESSICKLHPIHINSGLTMSSFDSIDVIVYRNEEVFKVLLHELIHAFGLDFAFRSHASSLEEQQLEEQLKKRYATKSPLYVNESFTDTWACFLNACVFSSLYSLCFKKPFLQVFHASLSIESTYIINKGMQMQERVDETVRQLGCYEEETHVISYYILKSQNYRDFDGFLQRFASFQSVSRDNKRYTIINQSMYVYLTWLIENNSIMANMPKIQKIQKFQKFQKLSINNRLTTQEIHSMRMSHLDCMALINCMKNKLLKAIVV